MECVISIKFSSRILILNILYIKYINPSSCLKILCTKCQSLFVSTINFVYKMSSLFFVHFIFCARNVLTFCIHFIFSLTILYPKVHFVPGNSKWPTVSVANTPILLGRRTPSKEAGWRPAIQRVNINKDKMFLHYL